MEDKKQGMYERSKELKAGGWTRSGSVLDTRTAEVKAAEQKAAEPKEVTIKKVEAQAVKVKVPGAGEPSYLPPVVTLPGTAGCKEFLAMSTLKKQRWEETYEPALGLDRGTIFPELDFPFVGEGGKKA